MKNILLIATVLLVLTSCATEDITSTYQIEKIEAPTEYIEPVRVPFSVPEWLQGEFKSFALPNSNLMVATETEIYIDLRQAIQPSISGEYIINDVTFIGGEEQPDYFTMELENIIIRFSKTTNQDIQVTVWKGDDEYNLHWYIKQ